MMRKQRFKPCWLKLGSHQNKHLAVLVQHTRIAGRKADTSKYHGGSSKGWSSKWKGSWDKQSYWEHDQWENHYGSGRGSEQPKSPGKGPKKEGGR